MSDYISRADAIEAVAQQWLFEASVGNPYVNDDDIGEYRKLAEELFEDVPSADAVSRKAKCCPIAETCMSIDCPVSSEYIGRPSADAVQGEWIRVGHDIYECSLCHQNVMTRDIDCYAYCHRCGARMLGEDGEADETD